MAGHELPTGETEPKEPEAGFLDYSISDEERAALPLTARIALAITSETLLQPFDSPRELTAALMEETQLERETLIDGNKELLREGYTKLDVHTDEPGKILLHLTSSGLDFLDKQIKRVQGDASGSEDTAKATE